MSHPVSRRPRLAALAPLAAASVLSLCAPMSAHALSVTYNNLVATGTYAMNGGSVNNVLPWLDTPTSKDVLEFTYAGVSGVGMHSYGDTNGNFGSRSSGSGVYDVTGSFSITLTLFNDSAAAQAINFGYYITPGMLNLSSFAYTGSQFTSASMSFSITTSDNRAAWSSAASLYHDASGLTYTQTGEDIYGGSGDNRTVNGGSHSLDLGVLNAGESLSLTYTLNSAAKGDAVNGTTTTIPAWDEVIPAHWVEYTDCGYGYGEPVLEAMVAGDGVEFPGGECQLVREFVPETTYHHDEQTLLAGETGGSHASSGDPFAFTNDPFGSQLINDPNAPAFGIRSTSVNVPEPGALSLVGLALAGLAWTARRRRA